MREGKYVDELLRRVREIPDDAGLDANEFVQVASIVARQHPVWYELFYWRDKCVKVWRWVTSETRFGISKKPGGSNASGA